MQLKIEFEERFVSKNWDEGLVKEVINLYNKDYSPAEIAKELGYVKPRTVIVGKLDRMLQITHKGTSKPKERVKANPTRLDRPEQLDYVRVNHLHIPSHFTWSTCQWSGCKIGSKDKSNWCPSHHAKVYKKGKAQL